MSTAQRRQCSEIITIAQNLLSEVEHLQFDYRRLDVQRPRRDMRLWADEFLMDIEEENENRRRKIRILRGRIAALQDELGTGS